VILSCCIHFLPANAFQDAPFLLSFLDPVQKELRPASVSLAD
jgi:hypothetical protein